MSTNTGSVLATAGKEVGVHEVGGNNRGKRVEEYLACVGLHAGDPWCAAFVAWCLREAGATLGGDGWPKTGFCPTIETWAKQRGVLRAQPQAGDVFLLCDAQGPFHTGFVVSVNSNGTVETIEGNTNDGGSADGDGVFRRRRNVSACEFVRWDDVLKFASKSRTVKIFRKPTRAVVIVDGVEYTCTSMSINGEPPAAGSEIAIVAEY